MTDTTEVAVQTDLATLFAKDPLKMVESDFRAIIEELRTMRKRSLANERGAGSTKPVKVKVDSQAAQLSVKDLGLDL